MSAISCGIARTPPRKVILMQHAHDVAFDLLTPEDAIDLLHFELAERDWFEQHIEARPERFYTPQGVAQHIVECLALHAQRRMSPLIVRWRGRIVGRANLRDIDNGQARVGYRIAQAACGQGLAHKALHRLIEDARCLYGITRLEAIVAEENAASWRVLEKAGFRAEQRLTAYSTVLGSPRDCQVFCRRW